MHQEVIPAEEVVCLVFIENDRFLMEQRLDNDNFHKHWTFPGGRIERIDFKSSKDPIIAASIRESDEELGLIPEELDRFTSFDEVSKNGRRFRFHGLLVKKHRGVIKNKELGRRVLDWIPRKQAESIIGDNAVDQRILKDFIDFLGS